MALSISEVRVIVGRVFAQQDVLDACARHDLGRVILILGAHGLTQGRISELTGISQGRLSEWARRKRKPRASSTFEAFADGLGVPSAARQALGLASDGSGAPEPGRPPHGPDRIASPARALPATAGSLARVPVEGVAGLLGRETVLTQLDEVIAALQAQQSRRAAGSVIRRPVWKNLVFTGGAGTGKSRAAVAVGQAYRKLGVLATGHIIEAAAADLVGTSAGETGKLVAEAIRPASGGILMINEAHQWQRLPDHGQQVLRRLYEQLTEYRNERRDELAMILAGQAAPLRSLLHGSPSLAARFRAVIDFPTYTPGQLAVIFGALADEAGLTLTPAVESKVAGVLARAEGDHGAGNARLAVRLLNLATAVQALRVGAASAPDRGPAALDTLSEADIPDQLESGGIPAEEHWPGQYLLSGWGSGEGRARRRPRAAGKPPVTRRQPRASSGAGIAAQGGGPFAARAGLPAAPCRGFWFSLGAGRPGGSPGATGTR
jgi:transcriptional regulator with XRE-family HTH domain